MPPLDLICQLIITEFQLTGSIRFRSKSIPDILIGLSAGLLLVMRLGAVLVDLGLAASTVELGVCVQLSVRLDRGKWDRSNQEQQQQQQPREKRQGVSILDP